VGKVIHRLFYRLVTLFAILVFAGIAEAQLLQDEFGKLEGVGVDEKLEAVLPLALTFKNSSGREVTLGEILSSGKPLLLSLNYSDCPMLCRLQLNGLVDGMRQMRLEVGTDFDVVSVSVDPLETPMRARQTKQNYVRSYGRPQTASGWHFLCGDKSSIDELADSVGFRFKYVPERDEYAHAAVTIVITPGGVVSRYLYGVVYEPQTLRLALVEAAEGKIGTTLDRVLLFCFHYDAASGRYAPVARNLLKVGGVATLIVMAAGLIPVWLKRRQVPVTSEVVA
jgi:protein SCO1